MLYRANDRALPAVVISNDHHRRSLTLAAMMIKNENSRGLASGPAVIRHVSFKEEVVAGDDVRAKLAPLLADETLNASTVALISEYAICSECRGVFHVYPAASADSDQEQLQPTIEGMQLELDELNR